MIGCLCMLGIILATGLIFLLYLCAVPLLAITWLVFEFVDLVHSGISRLLKVVRRG